MIRTILATAGVAVALSGCALLSSPDPVQLYRFGSPDAVAIQPAAEPVQVKLRAVEFPQESQGDRLLGVTGTEAAYIKGARWVSPASQLYADSLEGAFAGQARAVRLIGRRELTPTTRVLDIDVRSFETRYDEAGGVPTVVLSARARLLRFPERTVEAEQSFEVRQPATGNRIATIVDAYDVATRDLNARIVAWTDANATGD
ncbi:membrane integrity-associated transporter subunit PqiC [Brevundimonas sp. AJA228-03]|uniref:ABC-type transport auxiliary lipoprotein family protein n=1 Tax=Brevundimonas sp. AJA228-03 TaxID=2752515 RepID=UPI001AE045D6|nr:ABC-type transport auxiliary lipoprotein family protein [Brevundimonas sp. AJA228-03]QTN19013.1 membrane integrity-associated transporter subunit PqiC [Brevundimonas sp. AJA228-03]